MLIRNFEMWLDLVKEMRLKDLIFKTMNNDVIPKNAQFLLNTTY